jgi:hypothetical protein
MDLSIFLARLMGLYMLIFAAILILRKNEVMVSIKEMLSARGYQLLAGFFSLLAGLAIAIGHPIWEANWRVIITILGYLAILKGVMRIGFPKESLVYEQEMLRNPVGYWIILAILVVLGIILTYFGFSLTY